jgi:hypothetical protein
MPVSARPSPRLVAALWLLLLLFVLRVTGQVLVAFFGVTWLPPMSEWYSGLMSYQYLLPSQILIIGLMTAICRDFSRGEGFFVEPKRFFGVYWLYFGYVYLAVMVARYPIQMIVEPETRWFGRTIPIFFHWILASYVILVGRWHRRRLDA